MDFPNETFGEFDEDEFEELSMVMPTSYNEDHFENQDEDEFNSSQEKPTTASGEIESEILDENVEKDKQKAEGEDALEKEIIAEIAAENEILEHAENEDEVNIIYATGEAEFRGFIEREELYDKNQIRIKAAAVEETSEGVGDDKITDYVEAETEGIAEPKSKLRKPQAKSKKSEGIHYGPLDFIPGIHGSDLSPQTFFVAQRIADYVLQDLDHEVKQFFEKHHLAKKIPLRRISSDKSIESTSTLYDPEKLYIDEPSTMDLYYEKGVSKYPDQPLSKLRNGIDAGCQEHLHRSGRKSKSGIQYSDEETQTKEMTFVVNGTEAEKVFRHLYPNRDDYVKPPTPSRRASMDVSVETAKEEDLNVDRATIGPKVKWSKKVRLLPSLPQDYHKVETFWTGSTFRGKYVRREFDHGVFEYPLMSVYESEFDEGKMQSKSHLGLVTYPHGDTFEGHWRRGRHLAGKITFGDGLRFRPRNWTYCTYPDRRFNIETDIGVKQAGRTLYSDRIPPPLISPGLYDTGDGTYNPTNRKVTGYGGQVLRKVNKKEHRWILEHCRKSKLVQERRHPAFNVNKLPCSCGEKYVAQ